MDVLKLKRLTQTLFAQCQQWARISAGQEEAWVSDAAGGGPVGTARKTYA